jgi:hypothetical protein
VAFTISAALLGLGAILAILMLPSRHRLAELSEAAALTPAPQSEAATPTFAPQLQVNEPQPQVKIIPVALVCCSPVIDDGRVTMRNVTS